jgi:hypothetical protein
MPRRRKIGPRGLIILVNSGEHRSEIMKKLGLKTSAQLNRAYLNALIKVGVVPGIRGSRGYRKIEYPIMLFVEEDGSIAISKNQVEQLGIKPNDRLVAEKTKAGILLS